MNSQRPVISNSDIAERLSLRDLATFLAVVERGGVSRAAATLGYAQSTVTLHVQNLEAALGVPLFERVGRRLVITPAGQRLAAEGAGLLDRARRLYETATRVDEATQLFISSIEPFASRRLPAIVATYQREHPDFEVDIRVRCVGSTAAFELLRSEQIALAICSRPTRPDPAFTFTELYRERLIVLVPTRHRLASAKNLRLTDLGGERVLVSEETCVYRRVLQHAVENGGLDLALNASFGNVTNLPFAVAAGLGIAVLPAGLVTPELRGTRAIPIANPPLDIEVGFALPRKPEPHAAAFAAFLRRTTSAGRSEKSSRSAQRNAESA
jgi:DNA-binding transcriptional LysR family regulator